MIAPSFTWHPNEKTSLTALLNYQYDPKVGFYNLLPASGTVAANPFGIIPTSFDPGEPGWDMHGRRQYNASYLFSRTLERSWSFQQNFRYMHLGDNFRNVYIAGLLAGNRTISRYSPMYGATIATPSYASDDHVKFHQTGIYGQDQLHYKRLAVTIGGREDWAYSYDLEAISKTTQTPSDHAFTGRAGAVFLAGHGLSPYYSYSTSFQPAIGVDAEGHQFKPTAGQQQEVGLKYQPGHFKGKCLLSAGSHSGTLDQIDADDAERRCKQQTRHDIP